MNTEAVQPDALHAESGAETRSARPARPIAVLYTGGTFGMVPSPDGLVANPSLEDEVASLMAELNSEREAAGAAPVQWTYAETTPAIDSSEMDIATLGLVADTVRGIIADARLASETELGGVVVIHGTDTMAYSSAHAAFALADLDVPVVFTGSQLPLGAEDTDAARNFWLSVDAASRGLAAGVWIGFNNRIIPAVRATKRSSEDFFAFEAVLPLADGAVGVTASVADRLAAAGAGTATSPASAAPRVGLVKVHPGLTGSQLGAILDECPAGIVLECYGAGTAPMQTGRLAEPIHRATSKGSVVIAVTQCEDGAVELSRYAVSSALTAAGAVSGSDLTTEAALGKLIALTRAGFSGAELRELLETNLIGERR